MNEEFAERLRQAQADAGLERTDDGWVRYGEPIPPQPGDGRAPTAAEMMAIFEAAGTNGDAPGQPADPKAPRGARDLIVALVESDYVVGRTEDERAYLVPRDGANVALFAGAAKSHLANRCRRVHGRTVSRSPLDEAWMVVEGMAVDTPKTELPLRVAREGDDVVVDLGDVAGAAIVVTAAGWSIAERSPVTFRRSRAMLALRPPVKADGSKALAPTDPMDALFGLLPVAEGSRDLFIAWMVAALIQNLPHPAPVFRGEQGSAKSTTARCVSQLIGNIGNIGISGISGYR